MPRFTDEMIGSEGEWCLVQSSHDESYKRRAIIRCVHDNGLRATVQFEDDESTAIVEYDRIELEGEEG